MSKHYKKYLKTDKKNYATASFPSITKTPLYELVNLANKKSKLRLNKLFLGLFSSHFPPFLNLIHLNIKCY